MKLLLVAFALLALHQVVTAEEHLAPKSRYERHRGAHFTCFQGKQYQLDYNAAVVANDSIVVLDSIPGLSELVCNVDQTQLLLQFQDAVSAQKFLSGVVPDTSFVVEGAVSCSNSSSPVRRILKCARGDSDLSVVLDTVPARYDEIFQDADINIASVGSCMSAGPNICLGVNTDHSCAHALGPIPIYSNKYLSISCSNCFYGFGVDLVFQMQIRFFKLEKLVAGFQNMAMNGNLMFDMNAQTQWSAGVDRIVGIPQPTTIVSFHVGLIPIRLWFELPVEITADASFQASAHAAVGVSASWNIGDMYVSWDPQHRWQHVKPSPKFSWKPLITGQAQFNAQASFAVVPTLKMHVDNVLTYQVTLTPTLDMQVQGSTDQKQLCASSNAEVTVVTQAELAINIPWLHVKEDKTWGPNTVYDSGNISIFHACA